MILSNCAEWLKMIQFQFTGKALPLFCSVWNRGLFWPAGLSPGENAVLLPRKKDWPGGVQQGAGQRMGWIPAGEAGMGPTCSPAETCPGRRVRGWIRLGGLSGVRPKCILLGPVDAGRAGGIPMSSGSHREMSWWKTHLQFGVSNTRQGLLAGQNHPLALLIVGSSSSLLHFRGCLLNADTSVVLVALPRVGMKPCSSPASFDMCCLQVWSKSEITSDYLWAQPREDRLAFYD